MSYLSSAASTLEYGVVQVGGNIVVNDGVISIPQSVDSGADITFVNITANGDLNVGGSIAVVNDIDAPLGNISGFALFDNTNRVITSITPAAGAGIAITNIDTAGPDTGFTVVNTGVLSLLAGPGISLTANTGNITISTTGADFLNTTATNISYTASATDEYIGSTASSAITITLPAGTQGRVYTIKDENGGSPKITVIGSNGEKIDGKNNYLIEIRYQSISLVFRNTGWWLI